MHSKCIVCGSDLKSDLSGVLKRKWTHTAMRKQWPTDHVKYPFTASLGKKTLYLAIGCPLEINLKGPEEFMHRWLHQEGVLDAVGHPTLTLDARERFNEFKCLIERREKNE
jgi:hypothetical protein